MPAPHAMPCSVRLPSGNASTMDLHPCVAIVDAPRGKLSVGQCFLPEALAGP